MLIFIKIQPTGVFWGAIQPGKKPKNGKKPWYERVRGKKPKNGKKPPKRRNFTFGGEITKFVESDRLIMQKFLHSEEHSILFVLENKQK